MQITMPKVLDKKDYHSLIHHSLWQRVEFCSFFRNTNTRKQPGSQGISLNVLSRSNSILGFFGRANHWFFSKKNMKPFGYITGIPGITSQRHLQTKQHIFFHRNFLGPCHPKNGWKRWNQNGETPNGSKELGNLLAQGRPPGGWLQGDKLVVEPTHWKNMIVKMGSSSPKDGDENSIPNIWNRHLAKCLPVWI